MFPLGFTRSAKTVLFLQNATETSENIRLNSQCKSNSPKRGYAFARRLPIQMRFPCAQRCSRSTTFDSNPFSMRSNVLSLDVCRSKCVFYMLKCVLARRESIQMRVLCAQMRSRSTPVDPNVFSMCSGALSLDACRSKCVSGGELAHINHQVRVWFGQPSGMPRMA